MKKVFQIIILLLIFKYCYGSDSLQWEWLNPQPIGNNISGLYGNHQLNEIYLTTYNNDLYFSKNFGKSFKPQVINFNYPFKRLKIFNDAIYSLSDSVVLISYDDGYNWEVLFKITNYLISDIVIKNDTNWFIIGNKEIRIPISASTYSIEDWHIILKSYNQGQNWDTISEFQINGKNLDEIFFNNDSNGYIISRDDDFPYPKTNIYRTKDSGLNWVIDSIIDSLHIKDITFLNSDTGYLVSRLNDFYETTDNGNTWKKINKLIEGYDIKIYDNLEIINDTTLCINSSSGYIYSTNNGRDWKYNIYKDNISYYFAYVYVCDISNAFASSKYNDMIYTSDTGKSWTDITNNIAHKYKDYNLDLGIDIFEFLFTSSQVGYLMIYKFGERNTIIKTENGGCTWKEIYTAPRDYGYIFFINNSIGFLSTGDISIVPKYLYYTFDGGQTWENSSVEHRYFNSSVYSESFDYFISSMDFYSKNQGVLIDEYNHVYCTNDAGKTWSFGENLNTFGLCTYSYPKIRVTHENIAFILANSGMVFKSTNYGYSWSKVNTDTDCELNSIYFTNENEGFIVGGGNGKGVILKTIDNGGNWETIDSMDNTIFYDIAFSSIDTGYIVGTLGIILKTVDGGENWEEIESITNNNLYSIQITENNIIYLAGENSTLIRNVIKKPQASYVYDSDVCRNSIVKFENSSLNSLGYVWNINDSISTLEDFEYTFIDTGKFSVKLISSNCVYSDTSISIVNVNPTPEKPILSYNDDYLIDVDTLFIYDLANIDISFKGEYYKFNWNNGDSNFILNVNTNKNIYVTAYTDKGCNINSDTVYVSFNKDSSESLNYIDFISDLTLFPNPTSGILNINNNVHNISWIEISNLNGDILCYKKYFKDEQINLSFYPNGIYLVRICLDQEIITKKILIK